MKKPSRKFRFRSFRKNEDGAVSVELALIATMLFSIAVVAVDYGLVFLHHTKVKNAVRSGLQYVSILSPEPTYVQDGVDENGVPIYSYEGLNLSGVLTAVKTTAPPAGTYVSRTPDADIVEVYSTCDDGEEFDRYDNLGDDQTLTMCAAGEVVRTYVRVTIFDVVKTQFNWPGTPETISVGDRQEVLLNVFTR